MKVQVKPGKYILAVSGGVDSMVLLDILAKQVTGDRLQVADRNRNSDSRNLQPLTSKLEVVVAHFDHGIRPDSAKDGELVAAAAAQYKLPFELGTAKLGSQASEATARTARYKFLQSLQKKHRADLIITAHHQDDLIETAIINILRGTGPRGLTAMANNPNVLRPLLHVPKKDILAYAKTQKIKWREDPTNQDDKYLRNYVRKNIISKLNQSQRVDLLKNLQAVGGNQTELDNILELLSAQVSDEGQINRQEFIGLSGELGRELISHWLKQRGISDYDQKTIERLYVAIKTAQPGTRQNIGKHLWLVINHDNARFEPR